ncbi:hypothetical protein RW64_09385 [Geobacter sulfurreducens]|nr:hypothetical protein RW64_09385 [Geobacter sulfurreducens]
MAFHLIISDFTYIFCKNRLSEAEMIWEKLAIIGGCTAVGAALGVFTGGVGIAAMGTAIGVSGPVAGGTVGAGTGFLSTLVRDMIR